MTTSGKVEAEYALPAGSAPCGIVAGAPEKEGALWFTESESSKIGHITTSGTITEYALPKGSGTAEITVGTDGNLWFTNPYTSKVGKITTSGTVTEYALPAESRPAGIVAAGWQPVVRRRPQQQGWEDHAIGLDHRIRAACRNPSTVDRRGPGRRPVVHRDRHGDIGKITTWERSPNTPCPREASHTGSRWVLKATCGSPTTAPARSVRSRRPRTVLSRKANDIPATRLDDRVRRAALGLGPSDNDESGSGKMGSDRRSDRSYRDLPAGRTDGLAERRSRARLRSLPRRIRPHSQQGIAVGRGLHQRIQRRQRGRSQPERRQPRDRARKLQIPGNLQTTGHKKQIQHRRHRA